MPKDADPLPKAQIEIIRRWIEQGRQIRRQPTEAPSLARCTSSATHDAAPGTYPLAGADHRPRLSAPMEAEIAVSGQDEVTIWTAVDGQANPPHRRNPEPHLFRRLAYARTKNLLAIAGGVSGELGEVRLVDPATGQLVPPRSPRWKKRRSAWPS